MVINLKSHVYLLEISKKSLGFIKEKEKKVMP